MTRKELENSLKQFSLPFTQEEIDKVAEIQLVKILSIEGD